MVFVSFYFLFVALRGWLAVRSRVHSLNMYCVTVHGPILMGFSPFFSEGIALSGALHNPHFRH